MGKFQGMGCDIEAGTGGGLYPYMIESPQLRWAFIRKVYTIVSLQLLVTAAISAIVNFVPFIRLFFAVPTPASIAVFVLLIILPIVFMILMIIFRERHPINLILLGLFTITISFAIGLACASKKGMVVLEAAVLTFTVVTALTLYTFWAAKRGHDFNFLGPFLFAALLVLMLYGIIQMFIPMGEIAQTIYGCIAAIVFSGFIIYDTDNLIKRYTYDQYACAAITLYLDIINLFMALLTAFGAADS